MGIIKVKHAESDFITIHKYPVYEDKRLSFKAVGILTYLIGHPDNWETRVEDLIQKHADKESSIRTGLKELRDYGYATLTPNRDQQGKIRDWDWTIYEIPQTLENKESCPDGENQEVDNHDLDKPDGENHDLDNLSIPLEKQTSYPDRDFPDVENHYHNNKDLNNKEEENNNNNNGSDQCEKPEKEQEVVVVDVPSQPEPLRNGRRSYLGIETKPSELKPGKHGGKVLARVDEDTLTEILSDLSMTYTIPYLVLEDFMVTQGIPTTEKGLQDLTEGLAYAKKYKRPSANVLGYASGFKLFLKGQFVKPEQPEQQSSSLSHYDPKVLAQLKTVRQQCGLQ
jgi:hypothetical protein